MMGPLRLVWMLLHIAVLVTRGVITLRHFPVRTPAQRQDAIRDWSQRMLRACRVDIQAHGRMLPPPCLLAINHVSWLDIIVLNAIQPTRFVAKSDIDRWPLLGTLARGAGTLFIERERPRDAMRVVHRMAEALRLGQHVSVFPEGTTSDGREILPLHANLFQAAVSTCTPVQPGLLRYLDARSGNYARAPAYVGDETMLETLWRMACAGPLRVEVQFLSALEHTDRRALSEAVNTALNQALASARNITPGWHGPLQSPPASP